MPIDTPIRSTTNTAAAWSGATSATSAASASATTASAATTAASASTAANASNGAASTGKADEQSDKFLKLLVAQMKNQDPLNPLDNAQVTTQMAQISTVEGIENLNTTMKQYVERSNSVSSLEGASLIGRSVLVPGENLTLSSTPPNGTVRPPARGGFELTQAAELARIEVLDAAGAVVATRDMRNLESGIHNFAWDGLTDRGSAAAPGSYRFRVSAGSQAERTSAATLQAQPVSAVMSGQDGPRVEVGGRGRYSLADIRAILQESQP